MQSIKPSLTLLTLFLLFNLSGCATLYSAVYDHPADQDRSKRTLGSRVEDFSIETKAKVNIRKADVAFKESHIIIHSFNGIVLLVGQVQSERLRSLAEETARDLRKVIRVHNELTVSGPTSMPARANDRWITSKVKARMFAAKKFPATKVKVITENSIVFLMGFITRDEAKMAIDIAQRAKGIQRIVTLFEYY